MQSFNQILNYKNLLHNSTIVKIDSEKLENTLKYKTSYLSINKDTVASIHIPTYES